MLTLKSLFTSKKSIFRHPVIVIESDDWGTIRMKDRKVLNSIQNIERSWADDPYMQLDRLESNDDVESLFEVLLRHRDSHGNYACITANCILQNPDFKAIKESNFERFVGVSLMNIIDEYPDCDRVLNIQKRGIELGLFFPQFHGREHIHIRRWLDGLKRDISFLRKAFEFGLISFHQTKKLPCVAYFMDAMNPVDKQNLTEIVHIVKDGLEMFHQQWGYRSDTMIAPCYFWNSSMEAELESSGIGAFQGLRIQKHSDVGASKQAFKKIPHKQFSKNKSGQFYFVRKAFFEPSLNPNKDWVDACLAEISKALSRDNVAIICSHRLNYIGSINRDNRDRNLGNLDNLLRKIKQKFPDCLFANSSGLLDQLKNQKDVG